MLQGRAPRLEQSLDVLPALMTEPEQEGAMHVPPLSPHLGQESEDLGALHAGTSQADFLFKSTGTQQFQYWLSASAANRSNIDHRHNWIAASWGAPLGLSRLRFAVHTSATSSKVQAVIASLSFATWSKIICASLHPECLELRIEGLNIAACTPCCSACCPSLCITDKEPESSGLLQLRSTLFVVGE